MCFLENQDGGGICLLGLFHVICPFLKPLFVSLLALPAFIKISELIMSQSKTMFWTVDSILVTFRNVHIIRSCKPGCQVYLYMKYLCSCLFWEFHVICHLFNHFLHHFQTFLSLLKTLFKICHFCTGPKLCVLDQNCVLTPHFHFRKYFLNSLKIPDHVSLFFRLISAWNTIISVFFWYFMSSSSIQFTWENYQVAFFY